MQIIAGLSLKNLRPRVWEPTSPFYLSNLRAVMISYADICARPAFRRAAQRDTLHISLGIPAHVQIYLDNGAFSFLRRSAEVPRKEYEEFVTQAKPDWYPVPQDYIPTPQMEDAEQRRCFERTMDVNTSFQHDGFVPILHISRQLPAYLEAFQRTPQLLNKSRIALGGMVPNLLRMPKAMPYQELLAGVLQIRRAFTGKQLHAFGLGGTATLHLAALLGIDSLDSAGWRNRAARGIVQLPGRGDRMIAEMGTWRGREPSAEEWALLKACSCPACQHLGIQGLKAEKIVGFEARAAHNLWVLLHEAELINQHLKAGTYLEWYASHLDNSIYRPLVEAVLALKLQ